QLFPDGGLSPHVHSSSRVGGDQEAWFLAHLPADDEFLLVTAGQGVGDDVDVGGAHVVLGDDAFGVGARTGAVDPGAENAGRFRLVAEDPVLPQRRFQQDAVPVAVLGDVSHTRFADAQRVSTGDFLPLEVDAAGGHHASRMRSVFRPVISFPSRWMRPVVTWRMPMIASMSSDCPLPSTPAMPTISPRWMA